MIGLAGDVTHKREKRNSHRILVGKPEGTRHIGADTITVDSREIRWEDMDWIRLAQYRDVWRDLVTTCSIK
jgi:hypothetical protein